MSALDRVLQRAETLNFDNHVVALIRNLKRYEVLDQPIETNDGSIIEVLVSVCEELDLMDLRIMRIEEAMTVYANRTAYTGPDDNNCGDEAEQPMQKTIDGGEEPHAKVAEAANPASKKATAKKAAK